nr:hypothetical protein [Tanacetum cinerariifolium]
MPNVLTTHPTLILDSDFIPSDNSLSKSEIFYFDIEKKNSGSTSIHADISLLDLECFNFKPDPGVLTSIVDSGIRKNVPSATNVNLPLEKDHSPLFAYVVWIVLSFLTYPVVPPNLLSFGNEDTILTPASPIIISLIYCRMYLIGWKEKPILDAEGNPKNSYDKVFETYKNVTHEIRDQLNAEAEAVQ